MDGILARAFLGGVKGGGESVVKQEQEKKKATLEEKKQEALMMRQASLERIRHENDMVAQKQDQEFRKGETDRRITAEQNLYDRGVTEEENRYRRRVGEDDATYKRRMLEDDKKYDRRTAEEEKKYQRRLKESGSVNIQKAKAEAAKLGQKAYDAVITAMGKPEEAEAARKDAIRNYLSTVTGLPPAAAGGSDTPKTELDELLETKDKIDKLGISKKKPDEKITNHERVKPGITHDSWGNTPTQEDTGILATPPETTKTKNTINPKLANRVSKPFPGQAPNTHKPSWGAEGNPGGIKEIIPPIRGFNDSTNTGDQNKIQQAIAITGGNYNQATNSVIFKPANKAQMDAMLQKLSQAGIQFDASVNPDGSLSISIIENPQMVNN